MTNARRLLATTLAVGAAVLLPTQPAHAATVTTWTNGVKVASPIGKEAWIVKAPSAWSWSNLRKCTDWESRVWVRATGDYVYVKDECADGRSAAAQVTFTSGGKTYHRLCRNTHGNGTWARCNYDWPEGGLKQLTAGVQNQSTGYLHWDYGAGVYFSDSGFKA